MRRYVGFFLIAIIISFLIGIWRSLLPHHRNLWKDTLPSDRLVIITPQNLIRPSVVQSFITETGIEAELIETRTEGDFVDKILGSVKTPTVLIAPNYLAGFIRESRPPTSIENLKVEREKISADFLDLAKNQLPLWLPWNWDVYVFLYKKDLLSAAPGDMKALLDDLSNRKLFLQIDESHHELVEILKRIGSLSNEWVQLEQTDSIGAALDEWRKVVLRRPFAPQEFMNAPQRAVALIPHGLAQELVSSNSRLGIASPKQTSIVTYLVGYFNKGKRSKSAEKFISHLFKEHSASESATYSRKALTVKGPLEIPVYLRSEYLRQFSLGSLQYDSTSVEYQKSLNLMIDEKFPTNGDEKKLISDSQTEIKKEQD